MALKLVTAPAAEPVTLDEARAHLRITDATGSVDPDAEALYLEALIVMAREMVEKHLERALITQTLDLVLDKAPSIFDVPMPPLQSVTGVYVTDVDGQESAVDASNYYTDTGSEPGRIALSAYGSWPTHRGFASFRVRFVAGYGLAAAVPQTIKTAILLTVAALYADREHPELPAAAKTLLAPYRILRY